MRIGKQFRFEVESAVADMNVTLMEGFGKRIDMRTRRTQGFDSETTVEAVFARQLPQLELMTHIQGYMRPGKITIAPDTAE
ncbi:hypothetical protein DUI87_24977 [Hirundo rustica rustica]|uniref:Uncharacterized protein n=1 Tax=Hirundo rustica rustica TaxID=333673 RepID=A0A3M0JD33_HIRRU|nr:hypothetical protein DUI87_24977 [Hirundo rustica rustica]